MRVTILVDGVHRDDRGRDLADWLGRENRLRAHEGTALSIEARRVDDPQSLLASIADYLAALPTEQSNDETA